MSGARRCVWTVLLLAGTGALAADADRASVIAVGKCDEASAIAARSFRSALAAKPEAKVASEAETAQPFGGTIDRTLSSVTGAISSARSAFYGGQAAQAKTTLQGALDDVVRLPPSDARWAAERDGLTLLAQVLQKSDPKGAEAALNRVFRVEPDYQPDTANYPPSFQKYVNGVRKAAKKKSTTRLDVTTSPAGKPIYVGGRKVGTGPVSLRVPPGEYRVEADWGHRGAVRTITVPSTPVELSAAVEGAVYPDGGPCVEASEPVAALARAARLTGGGRLIGVHPESAGEDSFVVATSANAQGQDVREARVKVQPGSSTTEALGLLADWAAKGGAAEPPVEVTRGPGAKPLAVAPVVAAGAAAGAAGAAAAASPATQAAPSPASTEPDPNATHFEAALRVGFGLPLGTAFRSATTSTDVALSDLDSFTIPIQLDVGVRLGGSWFLGAYFSYGFAGSTDAATCGTDVNCSPSTLRFGGQVHWHPLGNAPTDPWIGLGSGYEKIHVGLSSNGQTGSVDYSGWEFGNIQLGLDFALGSAVKIGPWVSFSIGQYSSGSVSGASSGVTGDVQNKAVHEWLMGGVRLVILP